jgi:hypothetical protein
MNITARRFCTICFVLLLGKELDSGRTPLGRSCLYLRGGGRGGRHPPGFAGKSKRGKGFGDFSGPESEEGSGSDDEQDEGYSSKPRRGGGRHTQGKPSSRGGDGPTMESLFEDLNDFRDMGGAGNYGKGPRETLFGGEEDDDNVQFDDNVQKKQPRSKKRAKVRRIQESDHDDEEEEALCGVGILLREDPSLGLVVHALADDGPAATNGGILKGDVLCEVDGTPCKRLNLYQVRLLCMHACMLACKTCIHTCILANIRVCMQDTYIHT